MCVGGAPRGAAAGDFVYIVGMNQRRPDDWLLDDYHSFSEGRPRSFLFQELSLDVLPQRQRYEFFGSEILAGVDLPRPNTAQRHGFHAEVVSMANAISGMHFVRADPFDCARTRRHLRREDGVGSSLIYVKSGRVHLDADGDRPVSVGSGEFVFLDGARPQRVAMESLECVQLDLARPVPAACRSRLPAPSAISAALNRSPLRHLLKAQLDLFPSLSWKLSDDERALQLASSEHLALAVLQAVSDGAVRDGRGRAEAMMYHAAQRCIARHLYLPTLDPDQVATALGCSRSTLYRLFAAHGTSVAASIREARLQRAHDLLCSLPRRPIGDIAARCGYDDLRSFHRAFRAHFACTPGEAREAALGGNPQLRLGAVERTSAK